MTATSTALLMKKPTPAPTQIVLVPWDSSSPEHVERMVQQRIACGWKQEAVSLWKELQKSGEISMQWVILSDLDIEKSTKLERHVEAYPLEKRPLVDTAKTFSGKTRMPDIRNTFIPVGHISLNRFYETPGLEEPEVGKYWIANLYISSALQGYGLGRAALDNIEQMATSEPLNAKKLALSVVNNEQPEKANWLAATTRDLPKIPLQDWYARRGYKVYKTIDNLWWDTDLTGKKWGLTAAFMQKDIT